VKALVTGTAGFIGSHLAERLLADGVEVRGVDRLSDYYDPAIKRENLAGPLEDSRFELIEGDLVELDLDSLLDGCDLVYHLAAQPGVRVSWGDEFGVYLRDNVLATQRLLEAARETSLERFVLSSSSSVYGDAESFPTAETDRRSPVSPYGVTKLAAEQLAEMYFKGFGVPTVTLRYFTIFGPRQRPDMAFSRFIAAALSDRPIEVYGDGGQERDYTYVADAVEATVAAGAKGAPGAAYNVAGGNRATVAEVIEQLGKLLGAPPTVENAPVVVGDARKTGADIARAREGLDYSPQVSLADGLAMQIESARERADVVH